MRLCIVASGNFFSSYGGGQTYVKSLVDELIVQKSAQCIDLSIISFSPSFPLTETSKDYKGVPLYEIHPEGEIIKLLKTISPDIVHAHGEKHKVATTCKKMGIKCIITAHHGGLVCPAGTLLNTKEQICNIPAEYHQCLKCYLRNTPTGLFWYPLLRRYSEKRYINIGKRLREKRFIPFLSPIGESGLIVSEKIQQWQKLCSNTDLFIAPSNAIAEALHRNGCPQNKISVIPHGVPVLSEVKVKVKVNVDKTEFYYVGRINYVKGIHIMLKAFSNINNNNIRLHIIGGAEKNAEKRYMQKLQSKYRRDTRIVWHGKMPYNKMIDKTNSFHCLIHPTICLEVFGLDISEALASKKYVIASRCGGAEMQIHDEEQGMLVPTNDCHALRQAMLNYLGMPKASRGGIVTMEEHVKKLFDIYSVYAI